MFYNRKSLKVITPFSDNPEKVISLSDMKNYMRVDGTTDDNLINDFIDIATEAAKQYMRRAIITETLELILDRPSNSGFDEVDRLGDGVHNTTRQSVYGYGNEIDLPFLPIQSITSIKTFDVTNAETTVSAAFYTLDGDGGRVFLNSGNVWPSNLRDRAAMKIRFVAGYGSVPSAIPAGIRQAVRQHVSYMYECRQSCEMPPACQALLQSYRLLDDMGMI